MFDLSKVKLPSAVEVDGDFYPIKTDFRYWLIFQRIINDKTAIVGDLDIMYEGIKPRNRIAGYNQLKSFFEPAKVLPRPTDKNSSERVLDYTIDSELIYAAFMEQYGIDLMDDKVKLHWHKFLALLAGLHDTKLNQIMSYRAYNPNDTADYKKQMQSLKAQWRLPQEPKEAPADVQDFFNKLK